MSSGNAESKFKLSDGADGAISSAGKLDSYNSSPCELLLSESRSRSCRLHIHSKPLQLVEQTDNPDSKLMIEKDKGLGNNRYLGVVDWSTK